MIRSTLTRVPVSPELQKSCKKSLETILQSGASGFPQLPEESAQWEEAQRVGKSLRSRFDHLVILGIGGSSLGSQVIAAMNPGTRLRFLENVDAMAIERVMHGLDPKKTGFLIVSKSGGTIETLAGLDYLREFVAGAGVDLKKQSHVMTESKDNVLGKWSSQFSVPMTLLSPQVGGRYSVLSAVGMIPAVFDGHDAMAFRKGAARALEQKDLAAELMGQVRMSWDRSEWITFFWFYEPVGRVIGSWLAQLWGESLGKKVDRQGKPAPRSSTPMAGLGPVDQHSLLQALAEGHPDKLIIFVRSGAAEGGKQTLQNPEFADCSLLKGRSLGQLLRAEAIATEEALHQASVSTFSLMTEGFDAEGMGEFMMLLQMVVAGLGETMGINPFDQPGVELGKRLAREFLAKP